MSKTAYADHAPVAGLKDITQYSAYLGFSPPRTTFSVPISIDLPAQMASVAEGYVQDTLLITLFAAFLCRLIPGATFDPTSPAYRGPVVLPARKKRPRASHLRVLACYSHILG